MRLRSVLLLSLIVVGSSCSLLLTGETQSSGSFVALQATTPGAMQGGHVNVSGTLKAGQLKGDGTGIFNVNASFLGGFGPGDFLLATAPLNLSANSVTHVFQATNTSTLASTAAIKGIGGGGSAINFGGHFSSLSTSGIAVYGEGASVTGQSFGGYFISQSNAGVGVLGVSSGPYGVRGTTSNTVGHGVSGTGTGSTGKGVYGIATNNSGANFGGYFESESTAGTGVFATSNGSYGLYAQTTDLSGTAYGVFGIASVSIDGVGVYGNGKKYGGQFVHAGSTGGALFASADATTGDSYGLQAQTAAPSGVGVVAVASASAGSARGIFARSSAPTGIGVDAMQDHASGTTYGGYFRCSSTNGTGIFSHVSAGTGATTAGYFQSNSTGGVGATGWCSAATGNTIGVYGQVASVNGIGVLGQAYSTTPSATPYGVRGQCDPATLGFAVYAVGDMGASGVKPFRIDHPLDPENKYLLHYATESPEPQNFYNGNVITDAKGYAWIQLPEYFEAINRDYKYTLTILDDEDSADFVLAKVSKKIRDNRFQIRTSKPRTEVCWRVDAVRNDLYCRYKKPKSEVEKGGEEIGKYQHPELYNLPAERGMTYRAKGG